MKEFKRIAKVPAPTPYQLYTHHKGTCKECISAILEERLANCPEGKKLYSDALDAELTRCRGVQWIPSSDCW